MTHETLEPVNVSKITIHYGMCPFGLDIGGTLTKVAYYVEETNEPVDQSSSKTGSASRDTQNDLKTSGIVKKAMETKCYLKFEYFDTNAIEKLGLWLKDKKLVTQGHRVAVTGGGAYKYEGILQEMLNVIFVKQEEMECLIAGLTFLIEQRNEVFYYDINQKCRVPYYLKNEPMYPILLINIGSGVSIVKVDNGTTFRRITGTCIGGGTVLGLARLLLGNYTFEQVVELSRHGNNTLDLVVGDLRGDAAGSLHLPSDTLASSFGRLYVNDQSVSEIHRSNHADIARSLITMVAYNIGYLACLVGRIHGVTRSTLLASLGSFSKTLLFTLCCFHHSSGCRFVFAGKFIHNHDVTMMEIRRAVNFYATYYHQNVTFINEQECKIPQRTCAVQPSKSICQKCPKQIWDESKRKVLKDQNTYCSQSQFSNEESVPCSSKSLLLSSPTARVSHDISHTREASDESKALFLTHDGYLGSLGAFLLLHKKKV